MTKRKNILSFISVAVTIIYSFGFISGIFTGSNHTSCDMNCSMDDISASMTCSCKAHELDNIMPVSCTMHDAGCSCAAEETAAPAVIQVTKNELAKNLIPDSSVSISIRNCSESGIEYINYSYSLTTQDIFIINSSLLI